MIFYNSILVSLIMIFRSFRLVSEFVYAILSGSSLFFYIWFLLAKNKRPNSVVAALQSFVFTSSLRSFFYEKNSFFLFKLFFITLSAPDSNLLFRSHYRHLSKFLKLKESTVQHNFAGTKYAAWFSLGVFLKLWVVPLALGVLFLFFFLTAYAVPFNKVVFIWFAFFMIFYWLVSGFVFFIKKYQFGKYTTSIQRFWKRSYILFWLLESCLLLVFVYLTFISSQESVFMFDQIQIYKTHLFSWRLFLYKTLVAVLVVGLFYSLLLASKWNTLMQSIWFYLVITTILTYVIWLEFYQFFHVVNFYSILTWNYDVDERVWSLDLEPRKTRTVNHYMFWLIILKFWHLLFVFGFWIFFSLRSMELDKHRYPLLGANYQNMIIFYIMSWICMIPWFKFLGRKFMDIPYFWFYLNNRLVSVRLFFNDLKLFFFGLLNLNIFDGSSVIFSKMFFYWSPAINFKSLNFFSGRCYIQLTLLNTLLG